MAKDKIIKSNLGLIVRIINGGLVGDKNKVRAYTRVLAIKFLEEGDKELGLLLLRLLEDGPGKVVRANIISPEKTLNKTLKNPKGQQRTKYVDKELIPSLLGLNVFEVESKKNE